MPKSIQEKRRKEYVPLDEEDFSGTVEVSVNNFEDEDLIKVEKKGKGMGSKKKKDKSNVKRLVSGEYTLIISEKPQAASKIANSLGKATQKKKGKVPYYELEVDGQKIVIACAVGHLYNLDSEESGWPNFDLEWVPAYKKNKWTRPYFNVLLRLAKYASKYVVATDYDVEGEVIGWNIVRFMGEGEAKRMKFSTLTKSEIKKSYQNLMDQIDWGQAIAGETRHNLDWLYGVNLSRALIESIKKAGRFKILSIGRVQGPALKLIVEKEKKIQAFDPKPYWQSFVKLKGHDLWLKHNKNIKKKNKLKEFKKLRGEDGEAKTRKRTKSKKPPVPFDLSTLQREAYRLHKISPSQTLKAAQKLYLDGLISYPRTSSQKIPKSIEPKKIIKKLKKNFKEAKHVSKNKPREGKKSDPAHPSIYPTGEYKNLKGDRGKILDLVIKRFISCFCPNAKIEKKRITFKLDKNKAKFRAKGLEIKEKGWTAVYPPKFKHKEIEDIKGKKTVKKSKTKKKMTKPPRRYTSSSIVTKLEKLGLGTKATRSNIVDTLYKRNYIKGKSIRATPLGIKLIDTLNEHSPVILDKNLTKEFEEEMEEIEKQDGKKDLNKLEEKTIKKANKAIKKIVKDIKENQGHIGKDLKKAVEKNYKQNKKENTLTKCPKCKKGKLRIIFNKKSKRYFIGCSNYPDCKNTYTLPPGKIKPSKDKKGNLKKCKECGWPILMRLKKGKRPWFFCFNPKCEKNKDKEWAKKRNGKSKTKKKAGENKKKKKSEKKKSGKSKKSKKKKGESKRKNKKRKSNKKAKDEGKTKSKDKNKVECPQCGKEFDSERGMKIHKGQKH